VLIGHGKAILDVVTGEPMGGYMDRMGGIVGVHDDLEVHAVAFGADGRTFVLIVVDLICVNRDAVDAIRDDLRRRYGVDVCWVAATHTHAGPESGCQPGGAATTPGLLARMVSATAGAAGQAIAASAEGRVGLSRAAAVGGIAGRRSYARTGTILPFDVISVRNGGVLRGVIVVSPIHPTVCAAQNRLCSADLNGGIRRALTARLASGPGSPWVVVATGAAGDISTRRTRRGRSWEEVDRLGDVAARAIVDLLGQPKDHPPVDAAELAAPHTTTVNLSPKAPDDVGRTPSAPANREAAEDDRNILTYQQGLRIAAEIDARQHDGPYPLRLETIHLDGIDLLAVPAEMFLSLAEDIRRSAPVPDRFVLFGYTNGYLGYLPDRGAYADPAYEVLASPVAPGSGESVVHAATALVAASRSNAIRYPSGGPS
jgi:hypothetical protein